ncbi:tyrosine-type recombinase/integrase [Staphylococcus devriesei]|uniref:site-specific integrase n=1 Tax=Staphylococcus devriesei TaxID=586733 RepID=UPI000CD08DDB|nr:tyrosine-type recombinase/integrase [Staphylococcus devriesei]PNZ87136.1 site-specific integrase [Staphylococcus devriesei]PTF19488.1 site-specific integrase [Staphylococcus devriesei]SUM04177.1 phage integrase [Staphylococcus devriesei]
MAVYKDEKTNKWYFSTRYKDVYGNNKRKLKRGYKTKREAKNAEASFLHDIQEGYNDTKTFDYIFNHYLENSDLRPKTKRRKQNEYKKHIQDKFGHINMNKITQNQCQEFRKYLMDNIPSTNTARTIWSGFKVVINYAKKYFGLRIDPTISIKPIPRVKPKPKFMMREEFEDRVKEIEEQDYQELFILMFYTGLRIGEAMALVWTDYNKYKKEISINKTMDISNRTIYPRPKTDSSEDIVPLPNFINNMLTERYQREKQLYKYFDETSYFIFGGMTPKHYSHVHKKFQKAFPGYNIHVLRHSYASYLANNGVDIFVLQSLMRHAQITETMGTYSHLYTQKKHDAIAIFDE